MYVGPITLFHKNNVNGYLLYRLQYIITTKQTQKSIVNVRKINYVYNLQLSVLFK